MANQFGEVKNLAFRRVSNSLGQSRNSEDAKKRSGLSARSAKKMSVNSRWSEGPVRSIDLFELSDFFFD